jgi:uncharacterized membrane protein YedE/YeeE
MSHLTWDNAAAVTSSDLLRALVGGALIGLSAGGFLLLTGRIAGVSGMVAGLIRPSPGEASWRAFFVAGLVAGGFVLAALAPALLPAGPIAPFRQSLVAGLLVGLGARIAGGCTSGHGVCGVGRLSWRSAVATGLFMALGMATVAVLRHATGGL